MAPVNWANDPALVEEQIRAAEDRGYKSGPSWEYCPNPLCRNAGNSWHGLEKVLRSGSGPDGEPVVCPGSHTFS